jgi:integrase
MSKRKERQRLFTRLQGTEVRWYLDARDYSDVGGKREALLLPGHRYAVTDRAVAEALAAQRLAQLQQLRLRAVHHLPPPAALGRYAADHLVKKAASGTCSDRWLVNTERYLTRFVAFVGADREVASFGVPDIERWVAVLRDAGLSGGSIRHAINSVSNLYRRAQSEGRVTPGYNPVAAMMGKPTARRLEAQWLDAAEASLLLESARTVERKRADLACACAYPLMATLLLTGGRPAEVLGLEVADVSFDRKLVTFRPNQWRRLKNVTSHRSVPLWPQLKDVLGEYLATAPPARLLFPSYRTGQEAMLRDTRKLLDAVSVRCGYPEGEIHSYSFRHSFTAAALQLTDHGAPISPYTVGKWLGHGGVALVNRVYGHLGDVRHRSEQLEFRPEQHAEILGERLRVLRRDLSLPVTLPSGATS